MKHHYEYSDNILLTSTGVELDLNEPLPSQIKIKDIARGLARQFRWNGHHNSAITVAEHSINVCDRVPQVYKLQALLHDASEAYLGDITRPLKKLLPDYKNIEDRLMSVIAQTFGFNYPLDNVVKIADDNELFNEWKLFNIPSENIEINFQEIENKFLDKFLEIN